MWALECQKTVLASASESNLRNSSLETFPTSGRVISQRTASIPALDSSTSMSS
eukprot:CAMPEP_0197257092 /NCGR_PEP_ID=MMETSP1429-20130617/77628_1 /TAXON_ID=49237 /ORGANISM="Chaetoceros  sp., Strain UNC1202" /LENGTH=52 /DNA_ID=CAMNT_0042720855 /DNA_START=101 /DNA_END=256 /DNA_ORIENTATION=+